MKLLASLLGCAAADYACCPYDDFGVVNPACPLTEKTPWAMQDNNVNADPEGVEYHVCKAWEANIDATMEGNEDGDNWGGCGFQRHFPWAIDDHKTGDPTDLSSEHCKMGMFACPVGTMTNHYKGMNVGGTVFELERGGFSKAGANFVFGQVTLGGVCKLWIPVRLASIDSVSIAGVHMNGGGTNPPNADHGAASVWDNTLLCSEATCATSALTVSGTAYCFSVVNVGEFMRNNMPGSDFQVMNANVAGKDNGGGPPILLQGPNSEEDFPVEFGQSIEPTAGAGGGTGTIVDTGANFDVVVHFKSIWCIRHWTIVDMQSDPDVNSGGTDDYPLADAGTVPQHDHTDVADKRFAGGVGLCGCCDGAGERHDNDVSGTPSAEGCSPCEDTAACTEFNQYALIVDTIPNMQWPNAGAWAAYYSFITCSTNQFMIYHKLNSVVAGEIIVDTAVTTNRRLVHSMFYNDIRHDYSNNHHGSGTIVVRGNFRQIGDQVNVCGPGIISTSDSSRCTWNWNFVANGDAEDWFEQTNPIPVAVWAAGAAVGPNSAAALSGLITNIVETHTFTITFQDDTDAGTASGLTHAMTLDAAKYFTNPPTGVIAAAGHDFTFTMHCLRSSLDGTGDPIVDPGNHANVGKTASNSIRDIFPDCYMGDEIHFEYTIVGGTNANVDHRISAWYSFVTSPSFAA